MIYVVALLVAGLCEVIGVIFLNNMAKAKGVKKAASFIFLVATFASSLSLLSYSMNEIAMSVAYAIWTGIGAVGAVFVGVFFNREKLSLKKCSYLFLIIFSVIMLKII